MSDPVRVPNAQSKRSLRVCEQRHINHLEPKTAPFELHNTGVDTVAIASAVAGEAIRTASYEKLTLLCDLNEGAEGAAITSVVITAEVAPSEDASEEEWYPLLEDKAKDGALEAWQRTFPITASGRFAFLFEQGGSFDLAGYAMRFKVGTEGTRTGTRVVLRGLRDMRAS